MTFDTWIYYLLAVLILTASPGPSSLLCMTKGVQSGFKLSIFTALGSCDCHYRNPNLIVYRAWV